MWGSIIQGASQGANTILSGALGMIGGKIADNRNYRNQKKLMGLQNEYNLNYLAQQQQYAKEMAGINQGYAMDMANWSHNANKDMWDYTNYENQVAHLEAAGLNPALLYGQGGGGGATAAGGTGTPGSGNNPSGGNTGAPQAIKSQMMESLGMGIQLGLMQAQKKKLEAEAARDEATATKTSGIDTEVAKTAKELNEAMTGLTKMNTEEAAAKIKLWGDTAQEKWQNARVQKAKADILEAGSQSIIQKLEYETFNSLISGIEGIARTKYTERQTRAIGEKLLIESYNAATGRMNAGTAADSVANELIKITGELDIKQKTFIKDCVYQGVHAAMEIFNGVTDIVKIKALMKAGITGIKQVTKQRSNTDNGWIEQTIEEVFKQ